MLQMAMLGMLTTLQMAMVKQTCHQLVLVLVRLLQQADPAPAPSSLGGMDASWWITIPPVSAASGRLLLFL
jgi:hypothetical protein